MIKKKRWWCEKCQASKSYFTSRSDKGNKYAMRFCKKCGEVVKEVKL